MRRLLPHMLLPALLLAATPALAEDTGAALDSGIETNECEDGEDNDSDGWVDGEDPDCVGGAYELGFSEAECNDGEDNDDDGYVDAEDPDCDEAEGFEDADGLGTDSGEDSDSGTDDGDSYDTGEFEEGTKLSDAAGEDGGFGCVGGSAMVLLPLALFGLGSVRRED